MCEVREHTAQTYMRLIVSCMILFFENKWDKRVCMFDNVSESKHVMNMQNLRFQTYTLTMLYYVDVFELD